MTTVSVVHCETSSGVVNPIERIGEAVKTYDTSILNILSHGAQVKSYADELRVVTDINYCVDAMSSFGAIPINAASTRADFLISSANKCLEGVPGLAFVICRREALLKCKGVARSLSLDLVDQFESLESTSQFRFTPPTHVMLALKQAIAELKDEGGVEGRSAR